jgi:FKBP-type peptidyl-prolyl cis-trans isomerase FkpA
MNNRIIFALLGMLLLVACSETGKRKKTPEGYEYEVVRKGVSDTIALNSYVFFNMDLVYKDSILQTSKYAPTTPVIKVVAEQKDYGYFNSLIHLLGKMHEGDSFHYYFPTDSFDQLPPGFEAFTEPVVYRVGITDVMDEAAFQKWSDSMQVAHEANRQLVRDRLPEVEAFVKTTFDSYKKGELNAQLQTTSTGLKYIIHQAGDGPKPVEGESINVQYYGILESDATMFDNSFSRGTAHQFPIGQGQVIAGWDEGLALFNKGTRATLFIPPALGYGAAGSPPVIPENAGLIFYVELEK